MYCFVILSHIPLRKGLLLNLELSSSRLVPQHPPASTLNLSDILDTQVAMPGFFFSMWPLELELTRMSVVSISAQCDQNNQASQKESRGTKTGKELMLPLMWMIVFVSIFLLLKIDSFHTTYS